MFRPSSVTAIPAAAPVTLHTTCSGQSVHQQAPYSCTATKRVDGTVFTSHLSTTADGHIHASIDLATPRDLPTLIHMTSHDGNSGAGKAQTDPTKVIPAGGTHGELDIFPGLCGQIDLKVVFTSRGNGAGRMSGAYVNNDTCKVRPPSTTSPPPATSIVQHPSTSTPGGIAPPPSSSSTVPVRHVPHDLTGSALPATGIDMILVPVALAFAAVGTALARVARRRNVA